MPIMQAFLTQPEAAPQRQALCAAYASCLMEKLSSRPERIRLQVIPVDRSGVFVAGQAGADLAMLHVYLLPGRSSATKSALIEALARVTTEHTGLDDAQVRVLVHEIAREDIGFGARTAAALGF